MPCIAFSQHTNIGMQILGLPPYGVFWGEWEKKAAHQLGGGIVGMFPMQGSAKELHWNSGFSTVELPSPDHLLSGLLDIYEIIYESFSCKILIGFITLWLNFLLLSL